MEDNETQLEVTVSRENGATIVAVAGELDAATTPDLERPLSQVTSAGSGSVVLDLLDCGFVDSTGLHTIIDARSAVEDGGGRFALCCVENGPVARVIEVALPGMLALYPTREAALLAVR